MNSASSTAERAGCNLQPVPLRIFVINLPRSVERRKAMERQLSRFGRSVEFFPAIEGATLRLGNAPEIRDSSLSAGELGCYLSHVEIWRRIVRDSIEHALVLEDDVTLDDELMSVCEQILSAPLRFDLVRLSRLCEAVGKPMATLPCGRQLLLPSKAPDGTQGYLVNREGAERLLDTIATPSAAIDFRLNQYWENKLRVLLLREPVVHHDASMESTISASGRAEIYTSLPPLKRLVRSLAKRNALRSLERQILKKT